MKSATFVGGGIFVLFVLLIGNAMYVRDIDEPMKYENSLQQIRQSFAKQMKSELNLEYVGSAGGRMHEKVEVISIKFNAPRRATVQEARDLILLVINKFTQLINNDEKIRPHLEEYPFPIERVEVSIAFQGINGRYADGSIQYVFHGAPSDESKLFYISEDPFTGNFINLFNESYKEAVKLNNAAPVQNPSIHQTTEQEEIIDQVLYTFRRDMIEECGLKCWSIGGKMTDGIEEIGARFTAFYRATQDEARELELYATEKLREAINSNDKLRPYLREYPFPISRMKMNIIFNDTQYASYTDGSMESIVLDGNEITYNQMVRNPQKDEENHFLTFSEKIVFAKETYEQALKIVQNIPSDKRKFKTH